jgi:hypothetical protein
LSDQAKEAQETGAKHQSTKGARLRTAKQIIDQAIKDNKWNEWILWAFAATFSKPV